MTLRSPALLLAALVSLFSLGPAPWAQSQKIARCDRPLRQVSLDLATGTITRGPVVRERAVATVADFTNLDLAGPLAGGYIGVDTGGGACEWIDAATKGFQGNASDLMSSIVFGYCSAALDVASGGPGGSVRLGFYEGYTVGGPAPSTGVGLFTLTGLPANTAHSSFFNQGFRCYFIEVAFADLVAFADGAIGYSWLFTDLGTDGVLAATVPLLSCIQSCSGNGPDVQGMVGFLDQYCPPGSFLSSFTFASFGVESYYTSIAMEIREAADFEGTAVPWNATGVNVDRLLSNAIVVGGTWTPSVTILHPHGAGGPLALSVRQSCVSGIVASSPVGGRTVQLLTQGPLGLKLSATHDGASGSLPPFAVPGSIALVCLPWAAQAVVLGGGFADLTSARCGVVGTIDAVPDP